MDMDKPEKMDITVFILTADKKLSPKKCSGVLLPTSTGTIGILKNHAPLITALDPGLLRIRQEHGLWKPIVLYGVGVTLLRDNMVKIMVTAIDEVVEEDLDQLNKVVDEATLELEQATTKKDRLDAKTKLIRAISRLEAKQLTESNKKKMETLMLKKKF